MNQKVSKFLNNLKEMQVDDLATFIKMPSIASQNRGVDECANWLIDFIKNMGLEPIVDDSGNYPVIMGEVEGKSDKSLLLYGHYDVQPVEEELWEFKPFGAEIKDEKMYGRGTVDDKGPVMAELQAIRAFLETGEKPPITVRFLIEGEEENGSPSLTPILKSHQNFLNSDAMVSFDDSVWPDGRPRVVCGIKGIAMIALTAETKREFHAMMSPLIKNPVLQLAKALDSMLDTDGRVNIDGFYDNIVPPTEIELEALRDLNWTGKDLLEESGQESFIGNREGFEALKFWIMEPTCNLQGIKGGHVRPNGKGVVPSSATAELRFGTVPDQKTEEIVNLVKKHLNENGFEDIQVELIGENPWSRTSLESDISKSLGESLDKAFGRGVAYQPTFPGSGPEGVFQNLFPNMSQAHSGFGPPEDVIHAPDEYIFVDDYLKGIESIVRLFENLSE